MENRVRCSMNKELLDKAMKLLQLQSVYLIESNLESNRDFDRCNYEPANFDRQSFRQVDGARVISPTEILSNDQLNPFFYKFYYIFGVRLVPKELEEINESDVLISITGTFEVTYKASSEVPQESIDEFIKCHVGFNAWPFWREFVHSTCARIGMVPPITIPQYRIPKDGDSDQRFDTLSEIN